MFNSKYSKFLTVLLVIVIIAIVGLLGYLGFTKFEEFFVTKDTAEFVDSFVGETVQPEENVVEENNTIEENNVEENVTTGDTELKIDNTTTTDNKTGISSTKKTYKGFNVVGTIQIPKINLKYPILEKVTKKSIETAVAVIYGPGPNEVGNTTIMGHNYRNGLFFSNLKKLSNGDKVYITDLNGNKVTYTIYNKYETTPEDADYMTRNTDGRREVSLSTCTDDSSARLIIWAKAD